MKKEKILSAAVSVLCAADAVLVVLQLTGKWKNAINTIIPLLGVMLILQAVQYWSKNRGIALFQLCAALFVLGVAVYILFF